MSFEKIDDAFDVICACVGVKVICNPKNILIKSENFQKNTRWSSFVDPYGVFITATENT